MSLRPSHGQPSRRPDRGDTSRGTRRTTGPQSGVNERRERFRADGQRPGANTNVIIGVVVGVGVLVLVAVLMMSSPEPAPGKPAKAEAPRVEPPTDAAKTTAPSPHSEGERQKAAEPPRQVDPATSFKAFLESFVASYRKQIKGNKVFNEAIDIRFDVKKTDSLVTPILGIVTLKTTSAEAAGVYIDYILKFSPSDGQWRLGDVQMRIHYPSLADDPFTDARIGSPGYVVEFESASAEANKSLARGQ